MIEKITTIHTKYLNKYKESNTICGNMLMSYYAIDTMILENNLVNLYGGGDNFYKLKYNKYKIKYNKLRGNI